MTAGDPSRATPAGAAPVETDSAPVWTPDGRRVLFVRGPSLGAGGTIREQHPMLRLMSVDVRTRRTRTLARFRSRVGDFGGRMILSPKGNAVLVANFVAPFETFLIDLRGRVLLRFPGIHHAAWSPDGAQVAFVRPIASGSSRGEVWTVSLSGHRKRLLPGVYALGEWLPGGWITLYRRYARYGQTMWLVRADGRGLRKLRGWFSAEWSPSARRVRRWRPSLQLNEFWTFDTRTGRLGRPYRQLRDDGIIYNDLGWVGDRWIRLAPRARLTTVLRNHSSSGPLSPDGRRVVFESRWACRTIRLWIADVPTGRATRITRGC